MKMRICLLAIILTTGLTLSENLASSAYPRATIMPSRIVKGDTVKLSLALAQATSSCVPTYSKIAYTVEKLPQDTFPPQFNLHLAYDEIPAKSGPCLAVLTDYGPQFTFTGLEQGNYNCIDKNKSVVATFSVFKNDSIHYEVSTLKNLYSKGQKLDVTYKVKNNSTHAVKFNFPSSCKFDMTLKNGTGLQVFHYMGNIVCGQVLTDLSLDAGEETRFDFPLLDLTESYGQATITAQLIGYNESAVSKKITINETTKVISNPGKVSSFRKCTWNPLSETMTFEIDKDMRVSMKLFSATGKNAECVLPSKFLTAGSHTIPLPAIRTAHGVFFVSLEGDCFTQTLKLVKL
jgi:Intracellular proteinase inhibitor